MRKRTSFMLSMMAGLAIVAQPANAEIIEKLDLNQITTRADKIFRGTVIDVAQESVTAGGGEIPVVAYTLVVDDLMKGTAEGINGKGGIVEIRMVGSLKIEPPRADGMVRFSQFNDVPKLRIGGDYVMFMTPESEIGLSVSVGFGQGAFTIIPTDKEDMAVNAYDNAGLGIGEGGPVSYDELKTAVLAASGQ